MNLDILRNALANNFNLSNLILKASYVICIAVVFEFIAWWAGRRIDRLTAPLIPADAGREAAWRVRRRTTLRQTPKIITRTLCYAIAVILVFDVFGVPVLSLSIAVGAIIALLGAALLPLLRDVTQGYALLAEDALAVGDAVDIDGHRGIVEKFTLRGAWLRDEAGRRHCLSNRDIAHIVVHHRRADEAPAMSPKNPPDDLPPARPRS